MPEPPRPHLAPGHLMASHRSPAQLATPAPVQLIPLEVPPPAPTGVCNPTRLEALALEAEAAGIMPPGEVKANIVQKEKVFEVARNGNLIEMYGLLRKSPHLWKLKADDGTTPLHAAASTGKMDMAQLLAQAGGDVRAKDADGWEPLHYACANGFYGTAQWLLEAGASVLATTKDGWQPMHAAADAGETQLARFIARYKGADLRAKDFEGHEPAHLAASSGHLEFLQWLVRSTDGRCATAVDANGWQPLHHAALTGQLDVVRWLYAQREKLSGISLTAATSVGWEPLHVAASSGHHEVADWLLHHAVPVDSRSQDGWQPLHAAAYAGHEEVVRLLISSGAQPQATTDLGLEPSDLARRAGHLELEKLILSERQRLTSSARKAGAAVPESQALQDSSAAALKAARRRTARKTAGVAVALLQSQSPTVSTEPAVLHALIGREGQPTPQQARALLTIQSRFRGKRARKLAKGRAVMFKITLLLAKAETRAAVVIQRRFRKKLEGDGAAKVIQKAHRLKLSRTAKGRKTSTFARDQAVNYIKTALDRSYLMSKLSTELAAMMEKGTVYSVGSAQIVTWQTRYFFVGDTGLMYQHVSRKMRPCGKVRLVPWASLKQVEALEDDSVYVATHTGKKLYLKLKDAEKPNIAAWLWATRLCQLSQLLGNEVSGHVAEIAYGLRIGGQKPFQPPFVPSALVELAPSPPPEYTLPFDGGLASARLPRPEQMMPPALAPQPLTSDQQLVREADSLLADEGEGEESAEEAARRRQWILYYVSCGMFDDAEDIGWDRADPPDPRVFTQPDVLAAVFEAPAAATPPAEEEAAPPREERRSLFGFGKRTAETTTNTNDGAAALTEPLLTASNERDSQQPERTSWIQQRLSQIRGIFGPSGDAAPAQAPAESRTAAPSDAYEPPPGEAEAQAADGPAQAEGGEGQVDRI
ncbi:hypothetical protein AB1Y20_005003 [Prymnesium parvum]|uniref:Uncharacterized protein n=1 Tax=Prymnesium parvum TaxID=97485 RepID=A0AB34J4Z0_PRYPA